LPDVAVRGVQVGCHFTLRSPADVAAVVQVTPRLDDRATVAEEHWVVDAQGRPGTAPPRRHEYLDGFGNRCERLTLPQGTTTLRYRAKVLVPGDPDVIAPGAGEVQVGALPDDTLIYLLPSRYCLPDELGADAWHHFGALEPGWARVQAVVQMVHEHLTFGYGSSSAVTTAADAYRSGRGVCRDYAHLAISFCRALNIPARYVFGYIPDIGIPPPDEPMDFCAWFEAYLDGRWYTFDARLNTRRIGRVVVGRGRDAVDVAMLTSYGRVDLVGFEVEADEVEPVP
jgi:transglutaminase-like putative cysteine protease